MAAEEYERIGEEILEAIDLLEVTRDPKERSAQVGSLKELVGSLQELPPIDLNERQHAVQADSKPLMGIWAKIGLAVLALLLAFLFLLFSGRVLRNRIYKAAPSPAAPTTQPASPK